LVRQSRLAPPPQVVAGEPTRPETLERIPGWKRPFIALEEPEFRRLWGGMMPGTMAI
jgi:hypothetical protein